MIIESELREQMARVVRGSSSLNDLYAWLMSRSWNMHRDSLPAAIELASEVEALLIERSAGFISDEDARQRIDALMGKILVSNPIDVDMRHAASRPYFTSSGRWLRLAFDPVAA